MEFDKDLVVGKGLCPDVIVISLEDSNLPEISYETGMRAKAGETIVARW